MKLFVLLFFLITCSAAGYLGYDWYIKTYPDISATQIRMYSWTDEKGNFYYSDKKPSSGADNIKETDPPAAHSADCFPA